MSPKKIASPVAHVFLDFDYTLVPEESTIQILQYALEHRRGANQIKTLIKKMGPKTSADQIQGSEIWTLIKAATYLRWKHVQRYVDKIRQQIHPAVPALFRQLHAESIQAYILSAAFKEWIQPIALEWGLEGQYVMANRFVWLGNRSLGYRPSTLLMKGKSNLLKSWLPKSQVEGPIIMVGDSTSDYKVYQKGLAQAFISADYYTPKPLDASIMPSETIKRVERPEDLFEQIMTALRGI
ncbi:MAG: haloacid dehalogenase-like hydrolase [Saprospiraceae bacterium]|nr:haloacid dehalogenase-like hydrolase [Saprospiraceae bacterium]